MPSVSLAQNLHLMWSQRDKHELPFEVFILIRVTAFIRGCNIHFRERWRYCQTNCTSHSHYTPLAGQTSRYIPCGNRCTVDRKYTRILVGVQTRKWRAGGTDRSFWEIQRLFCSRSGPAGIEIEYPVLRVIFCANCECVCVRVYGVLLFLLFYRYW